MEKELVSGKIGEMGKYDVEFKEGKLVVEIDGFFEKSSATLVVKVDAAQVLDALAKAVPGEMDDAAIALVKLALGV
jgi:hypothetical protein